MIKNCIVFFALVFFYTAQSQNHHLSVKVGYTKSSTTVMGNSSQFGVNTNGISSGEGQWFKSLDGFQIGVIANIDIGYDFLHLDIAPQFSRYGFVDNKKIKMNYLDFDIGFSNMNTTVESKFIAGMGVTPALLIWSSNLENLNNFDFKAYLLFGYRFYKNYSIYSQLRFGFLEILPESKLKNVQFSLNINIPIFKI